MGDGDDKAAQKNPLLFQEAERSEKTTPVMAQYLRIRKENPEGLLFYRMGDFYELFFDDAVQAAVALDIALTKRGRHQGEDIPMCGVPVHAAETYLERLIKKGFRVVVCEQVDNPPAAMRKAIIKREVVRVVTAGTLTEEALLPPRGANYLLALSPPFRREKGEPLWGMAWADVSTGEFRARLVSERVLKDEIARLAPGEILLPPSLMTDPPAAIASLLRASLCTEQPAAAFSLDRAAVRLSESLGAAALAAARDFPPAALSSCAALASYVRLTQAGAPAALSPPQLEKDGVFMMIDAAARANLELIRTLSGERRGSLLAVMDRSITGAGGRLLAARLSAPLTDRRAIEARLDEAQFFMEKRDSRREIRAALRGAPDLLRAQKRLALQRGTPRDLASCRDALRIAKTLSAVMRRDSSAPRSLRKTARGLIAPSAEISDSLERALVSEPPPHLRDGGAIASDYDDALASLRARASEGRRLIGDLQARYVRETGVKNLKIKHNNLLGHYVETPASSGAKLLRAPFSETFIHRQSLVNLMRFTTEPLRSLAQRIDEAGGAALSRERQIFDSLVEGVLKEEKAFADAANALAALDVACGLAELAEEQGLTRPEITEGLDFAIEGGRHMVVEAALLERGESGFIANDCHLEEKEGTARLWLLTGPNMAGKSTFLRQNALIALMAQMGSFVPAKRARIGVVDCLFSRVGAADKLAAGHSTFMVEMTEMAAILFCASERSLVIVDELGRGTATFDGLSIAWAVIEHLHDVIGCRGLFATHFHELTALEDRLASLVNRTMRVEMHEGRPIFLHDVGPGAVGASYGIDVAGSAGLPREIVSRARSLLRALERGEAIGSVRVSDGDGEDFRGRAFFDLLGETDPDRLTAREALELVYRLKSMADDGG